MTVVTESGPLPSPAAPGRGVWGEVWRRVRQDRVGLVSLWVVVAYTVLVILVALHVVAADWNRQRAVPFAPPTFMGPSQDPATRIERLTGPELDLSDVDPLKPHYADIERRALNLRQTEKPLPTTLPFGADQSGRDVLQKALKGSEISIFVGVMAALFATALGTFLGALSGYIGRWVGDALEWVYNVFTAIPFILLIFTFAAVVGRGVVSVIVILGLAGWTGTYRLIRAEYLKHAEREYVRAAQAIGASSGRRMFVHILPNVTHVSLVQLSLSVVAFIKTEVILSFLGLGVGIDSVSWGTMLSEAQRELTLGKWWQLAAATFFMAVFVTAFSLFTDSLRDALDPRLR